MPHAFGLLKVNNEPPPEMIALHVLTPAPHDVITTVAHVFTAIVKAKINYPNPDDPTPSVKSGVTPFNYTLTTDIASSSDYDNPVMVNVVIQRINANDGSVTTVRTLPPVTMSSVGGRPVTTTFPTTAVDDQGMALPAGNYQLIATRLRGTTPDPSSVTTPLNITPSPTIRP